MGVKLNEESEFTVGDATGESVSKGRQSFGRSWAVLEFFMLDAGDSELACAVSLRFDRKTLRLLSILGALE